MSEIWQPRNCSRSVGTSWQFYWVFYRRASRRSIRSYCTSPSCIEFFKEEVGLLFLIEFIGIYDSVTKFRSLRSLGSIAWSRFGRVAYLFLLPRQLNGRCCCELFRSALKLSLQTRDVVWALNFPTIHLLWLWVCVFLYSLLSLSSLHVQLVFPI